jgi:hypothetical protein
MVAAIVAGSIPALAQAPTLPWECLYPAHTWVSVSLPVPDGKVATALRITENNIRYVRQASISINGRPWVPLDNRHCRVSGAGAEWGGIGGPVATLILTVPIGAVRGNCGIELRQNGTNGVQSAWRVIDAQLLDAGGNALLAPLPQDDPATWKAPLTDAASIEAGREAWSSAPLVESPLTKGAIGVHCADCHASDGRDLKVFNYSVASIENRAQFHGLTALQAVEVASFIRSLAVGTMKGRPWNPPYQPGAGLDSRPVSEWTAGAGWGAVLETDHGLLAYLPAVGTDPAKGINLRETPIPMPLPTWNQWLPTIHPETFWGDKFTDSGLPKVFEQLAACMDAPGLKARIDAWNSAFREFKLANVDTIKTWTEATSEGVYSTGQWRAVKTWETIQRLGAEDQVALTFAPGPQVEPRGWPGNTLFETSPKALGVPERDGSSVGGSARYQHYLAEAWYMLQLIVNAGMGQGAAISPIDWPYDFGVIDRSAVLTGKPTAARLALVLWKAMQETSNGLAPSKAETGWSPRGTDNIGVIEHDAGLWRGYTGVQHAQVLDGLLAAWNQGNARWPASAFYESGDAVATEVPNLRAHVDGTGARLVDMVGVTLATFRKRGTDPVLLRAAANWAAIVWPKGDWKAVAR